ALARRAEAEAVYEEALALLGELVREDPTARAFRHDLLVACNNAGNYYSTRATPPVHGPSAVGLLAGPHARGLLAPLAAGPAPAPELDLGRAEALHRQAVALAKELVKDFPSVPDYRNQLANTHVSLGFVLAGRDLAGAAREWQTAHDLLAELVKDFPKVAE